MNLRKAVMFFIILDLFIAMNAISASDYSVFQSAKRNFEKEVPLIILKTITKIRRDLEDVIPVFVDREISRNSKRIRILKEALKNAASEVLGKWGLLQKTKLRFSQEIQQEFANETAERFLEGEEFLSFLNEITEKFFEKEVKGMIKMDMKDAYEKLEEKSYECIVEHFKKFVDFDLDKFIHSSFTEKGGKVADTSFLPNKFDYSPNIKGSWVATGVVVSAGMAGGSAWVARKFWSSLAGKRLMEKIIGKRLTRTLMNNLLRTVARRVVIFWGGAILSIVSAASTVMLAYELYKVPDKIIEGIQSKFPQFLSETVRQFLSIQKEEWLNGIRKTLNYEAERIWSEKTGKLVGLFKVIKEFREKWGNEIKNCNYRVETLFGEWVGLLNSFRGSEGSLLSREDILNILKAILVEGKFGLFNVDSAEKKKVHRELIFGTNPQILVLLKKWNIKNGGTHLHPNNVVKFIFALKTFDTEKRDYSTKEAFDFLNWFAEKYSGKDMSLENIEQAVRSYLGKEVKSARAEGEGQGEGLLVSVKKTAVKIHDSGDFLLSKILPKIGVPMGAGNLLSWFVTVIIIIWLIPVLVVIMLKIIFKAVAQSFSMSFSILFKKDQDEVNTERKNLERVKDEGRKREEDDDERKKEDDTKDGDSGSRKKEAERRKEKERNEVDKNEKKNTVEKKSGGEGQTKKKNQQ